MLWFRRHRVGFFPETLPAAAMMIGCAATGLSERDERVRVTAAACASDRDKDVEILVLRHQLRVLERQLGTARPRFSRCDRAFLAALLHWLPRGVLSRVPLLVRPETVLRWHRDLLARRHAARSRPGRPGRPRTIRSVRLLVLRLARENPSYVKLEIMWNSLTVSQ